MDGKHSVLHYALFAIALVFFFAFPASILATAFGYKATTIDNPYPIFFAGWAISTTTVCAIAKPEGGIITTLVEFLKFVIGNGSDNQG